MLGCGKHTFAKALNNISRGRSSIVVVVARGEVSARIALCAPMQPVRHDARMCLQSEHLPDRIKAHGTVIDTTAHQLGEK